MNRFKIKYLSITLIYLLTACANKPKNNLGQKEVLPKLNRPEVRRVWVPDQISGDEYISGHWKYLIDKNAVWSKVD